MENSSAIIVATKLTDYQALFYNEWLLNPTRTDYNMVLDLLLEGEIDKKRLNDSLIRFVNDHLLYNSNVTNNDGTLKWKLRSKIDQSTQLISVYESQIAEDEILKIVTEPFDLEHDLLVKFILIKNGNNNYRFINIQPHILVDGLSGDELIKQLSEYYNTYNYKHPQSIEQQAVLHNKLSAKFAGIINKNTIQINDFWQKHLNNIQANDLRFLYNNRINDTSNVNSINVIDFFLQDDFVFKLKAAAHKEGLTAYIISQIALAVSLHKHSGQTNIGISFPIAIQEGKELIYGAHVNTLIIDFRFSSATNLQELMQQARTYYKELKNTKAKYLPIGYISKYLEDKKILDLAFAQTNLRTTPIQFNNINCTKNNDELHIDVVSNIIFEQELKDGSLHFRVRYKTSIFDDQLVKCFIDYYKNIVMEISNNILNDHINNPIENEYSLKSENLCQLTHAWTQPQVAYPAEKTVNQIFEEQVELTPDTIAIEYMEAQLTYRQLNEQVNQLASYLKTTYKIQPNDFICLCLDKSEKMLIAILAVLKTGAAYVPISPEYPQSRINYILSDAKPRVIISNDIHKEKLQIYSENSIDNIVVIDNKVFIKNLANYSFKNPTNNASSSSIAYIIYTSGTTGNPKGVMIEHKSIINLALMQGKEFNLTRSEKNKKCLWFANYVFDAHVSEIFLSILNGHSIYIIDENIKADISNISDYCSKKKIDIATIPPAILNDQNLVHVQTLITAGDVTHTNIMNFYANNNVKVINAYGPTESTVCATLHHYQIGDSNTNIGRPIGNTTIYVLDPNMKPLPLGVIGELYIGGAGVARGYLNKPKLTAERFLKNPFQTELEKSQGKNGRIYKTGDLVRYMPDGNIEYIGRNDFQVKIRGFRIELGEIAASLNSYPQIEQSSVITHESITGVKLLVAYYVSKIELNESDLNNHMRNHLPEYMIPTTYIHLEKIPVTINGKLDRNALPKPKFLQKHNYVAPRNRIETEVCNIYANVLGLDEKKISIDDDFFRLGGDSITNIQVIGKLRQLLGLEISSKTLFKFRTIRSICDNIYSQIATNKPSIIRENGFLSAKVNLLPIQVWFFENVKEGNIPDYNHWNQAFMLETPKLDIQILGESIKKLAEYHDALRIHYKIDGDYIEQFYTNALADINLEVRSMLDVDKNQLEEALTQWQSNLDIESGPLFHVGYFEDCPDGKGRIHFAAHHLIIDTVSWRIIKEDLQRIYQFIQKEGMEEIQNIPAEKILGDKGTSYRQWVDTVNKYPQEHTEENLFWKEVMRNIPQENRILEALSVVSESTTVMSLDKVMTAQLLRDINHVYNTGINDILLSAFGMALKKLTGLKENHILLEGHGREEIDPQVDITHTVGWFTTMYPVRIPVETEEIGRTVAQVKDALRMIPANGIGYGAINGYIDGQLPRISFNYLGQFDEAAAQKENAWEFSGENTGRDVSVNNKNTHILSVNGGIVRGELYLSMTGKLPEDIMAELCEDLKNNLENIIRYLAQSEREYLTRSDVNYIISEEYLNELQKDKEVEAVYLANSLQQGFIYHALSQGDIDDAYRTQMIWDYYTTINPKNFRLAWEMLQKKYSVLRTRFAWNPEFVQIIDKEATFFLKYCDLSHFCASEQNEQVNKIISEDNSKSYDISTSGLMRIYLIKASENHYTCIFSCHHIIIDGWSSPILLQELHNIYFQLSRGEKIEIKKDQTYFDVQKYLQKHRKDNLSYWRKLLDEVPKDGNNLSFLLKKGQANIDISSYNHILKPDSSKTIINGELYENIKVLSQLNGFTINALLQYCWHKLLSIYNNADTTIVGMTVSGRNLPIDNIENAVGLFINTLPLVFKHNTNKSIIEEIYQLQDLISEINSKSNVNLSDLQYDKNRLFNSLFIFENYPIPSNSYEEEDESIILSFRETMEKTDYPINLIAYEQDNSITIQMIYASEIFNSNQIKTLLKIFYSIVEQLSENPSLKSDNLCCVPSEQITQILHWNQLHSSYSCNMTIHGIFENVASQIPHKNAVIFDNVCLSYEELNQRSNQLASYLISTYKNKEDDLIALVLDRSELMIIAILGILKAGKAYLPISPEYPQERISYLLEDSKCKVVITNRIHKNDIESFTLNTSILAIEDDSLWKNHSKDNLNNMIDSTNLAYIIYTSGTTGKPKGVMVEHNNVINLSKNLNYTKLDQDDNVLSLSNYAFDGSIYDFFGALLNGASLTIADSKSIIDMNSLSKLITKNCITNFFLTTALFNSLTDLDFEGLDNVKYILFGGEQVSVKHVNKFKKIHKKVNLVHVYGPTETTTFSTFYKVNSQELDIVPIGHPISNDTCYILDTNHNLVPIGGVGELYIGGAGVARGYLNRPELTEERFLKNPFQTEQEKSQGKNGRIYKTGDLVRYMPDGNIEYIGRNDFQVKIRGFRIELGEIEAALTAVKDIKQAVVLAKENAAGTKFLAAYYVAKEEIDEDKLYNHLRIYLPDYMIPNIYVHMKEMPLTTNGKIDRRILLSMNKVDNKIINPRNKIEQVLCDIYSNILGIDSQNIGIENDFFKSGGNSILAIKLINIINKRFNAQLKISDIYQAPMIKNISAILIMQKSKDNIMVKLNLCRKKPIIYMIHPGGGGCEAYSSLAEGLNESYSCYGIDSYNLYHEFKITNLNQLALYYLSYLDKIHMEGDPYILLGWSLGGLIALEIATILEDRGNKNIKVYLLDTFIYGVGNEEKLPVPTDTEIQEQIEAVQGVSYPNIRDFILAENELINQSISHKLEYTTVILFKALKDIDKEADVRYNNIDKLFNNPNMIKLIPVEASHHTIINEKEILISNIK